jgi:hypothetical protein
MWGEGETPTKIVMTDGETIWSLHDRLHRLDGPALIKPNGYQEWRFQNALHRLDGPAIIHEDGSEEWYDMDSRHRIGAPAVVYKDGTKKWFVNNNYFRLNKTDPVVIYGNDQFEWVDYKKQGHGTYLLITYYVNKWMFENNIRYPFNKQEEMEFALRFL